MGDNVLDGIEEFSNAYKIYFQGHDDGSLTCLDTAPRWAVWKNNGLLAFGTSQKEVSIIKDIFGHTIKAIQQGEKLGGWKALPKKDLFELEYWELEQAKLKKGGSSLEMQGKVALVTGAFGGIGKACVEELLANGCVVAVLDINAKIQNVYDNNNVHSIICDVTKKDDLKKSC